MYTEVLTDLNDFKGLVQEYLKDKFFKNEEGKELAIDFYLNNKYTGKKDNFIICEYEKGKKAIVDLNTKKVYTRNGFLFVVILQDEEYITAIGKYELYDVLATLNIKFQKKYVREEDDDEEIVGLIDDVIEEVDD